jgi:preprotein translocase subunit SecD
MRKHRIIAAITLLAALGIGYFVYSSQVHPSKYAFKLGLDLSGGTQLVYKADVSKIDGAEVKDSMEALRDVIERRVNLFGVSEPVVQVEEGGELGQRLIVELPGVTDVEQAVAQIGKTPVLEFKLLTASEAELEAFNKQLASSTASTSAAATSTGSTTPSFDSIFSATGLTGRFLSHSALQFDPNTQAPIVSLEFNQEGKELFAKITRENTGKVLAIILDGQPISTPVINEEIADGKAVISGGFTPQEAKELVRDLNYGSLPVPIELASTETIGPSLGQDAVASGLRAGVIGLSLVALFMILWYRLPGLLAAISLIVYMLINMALYKLIPVTLTAPGIAGFILSIGMSVDANILIFERMKEELRKGKPIMTAMQDGFGRAWTSIRDGNSSAIITAVVLFWFGTSLIKGFALTLLIGTLVSMFTAITVTRFFLRAIVPAKDSKAARFLFSNGVGNFGSSHTTE